jgi:hypothetical protein
MDFIPTPSGGCNQDTFSHTGDWTSVHKVHFGNQATDQMTTTESTASISQPDLLDYINNHLGVDFDTLQVQVAARKNDQAISQCKHPHFSLASISHPWAILQHTPVMYTILWQMTPQWAVDC